MEPDLDAVFRNGERLSSALGTWAAEPRTVAHLRVTSGGVLACDPLIEPDTRFRIPVELPAGTYPVTIGVLKDLDDPDRRVAAVRLAVTDAPVVAWERSVAHPVDSGASALLDVAAVSAIEADPVAFCEELAEQLERNESPSWTWASVVPGGDDGDRPNVIAFSAGYGDGLYASYVGRDAAGAVAAIVLGFGIVDGDAAGEEDLPSSEPVAAGPQSFLDRFMALWNASVAADDPAAVLDLFVDDAELFVRPESIPSTPEDETVAIDRFGGHEAIGAAMRDRLPWEALLVWHDPGGDATTVLATFNPEVKPWVELGELRFFLEVGAPIKIRRLTVSLKERA